MIVNDILKRVFIRISHAWTSESCWLKILPWSPSYVISILTVSWCWHNVRMEKYSTWYCSFFVMIMQEMVERVQRYLYKWNIKFQALTDGGIDSTYLEVPGMDHFSITEELRKSDYSLTKLRMWRVIFCSIHAHIYQCFSIYISFVVKESTLYFYIVESWLFRIKLS